MSSGTWYLRLFLIHPLCSLLPRCTHIHNNIYTLFNFSLSFLLSCQHFCSCCFVFSASHISPHCCTVSVYINEKERARTGSFNTWIQLELSTVQLLSWHLECHWLNCCKWMPSIRSQNYAASSEHEWVIKNNTYIGNKLSGRDEWIEIGRNRVSCFLLFDSLSSVSKRLVSWIKFVIN